MAQHYITIFTTSQKTVNNKETTLKIIRYQQGLAKVRREVQTESPVSQKETVNFKQ
jgi:hypothetical protein